MSTKIRLGTRGSQLALAQSNEIANDLRNLGHEVELVILKTTGDVTTGPLSDFGGEGVFTKRLQTALTNLEIDLAVHSLKDLPTEPADGLMLGAVPAREDPRDALIVGIESQSAVNSLADLPNGSRIGTGSVRRKAQLLNLRRDFDVQDIRGNVDTRLGKLDAGEFDAIILACAGLKRLGLEKRIAFAFDPGDLAPAVGQGALGLEVRAEDVETGNAVAGLNCEQTNASVVAERQMLNQLRAGCMAPVGAITSCVSELTLTGIVMGRDGKQKIQATHSSDLENAAKVGAEVARKLYESGAKQLIG